MDISTVSPLALPAVSLANRSQLPAAPGIYFAIDEAGAILYIGRARNLLARWKGTTHHRLKELMATNGVRLAYLTIEDESILATVEVALIARFSPILNQGAHSTRWRAPKATTTAFLTLPDSEAEAVRELAAGDNRSVGNMLARLIEEALAARRAA